MQWSKAQKAIFAWFEAGAGNLVVRARAGTGKTTTILEAINHAPEDRILLAAFNKTIATELSERLQNPAAEASTLHALGFRCIRRQWKVRVNARDRARDLVFAVDPETPEGVVGTIAKLHTLGREITPHAADSATLIELAHAFDCLPDSTWEREGWGTAKCAGVALAAMQKAREKTAEIDFADMIYLPLVNGWVRPVYDLVVVDEAQDMTGAQLELAQRSCRGRIAVVGDDRQAIYGFRGADSGSLDRLKAELLATELPLTTTYRCPTRVVDLAAEIVPDFEGGPDNPAGLVEYDLGASHLLDAASPGDFVLSRTNAPLAGVCLALLKRGVRAHIRGRDIGRGIKALVRKQRARTLPQLETKLAAWTERERKRAIDQLGERAEARIAFLEDQRDLIFGLCEGLSTISELQKRIDALFDDNVGTAVMCSTVHRAKGLEAPNVFVLEETFCFEGSEESNVEYVAITRTKDRLAWVTWDPSKRNKKKLDREGGQDYEREDY